MSLDMKCNMYIMYSHTICDIHSQANLENVREFKVALDQDRTAGMANFSEALLRAFSILERVRNLRNKNNEIYFGSEQCTHLWNT